MRLNVYRTVSPHKNRKINFRPHIFLDNLCFLQVQSWFEDELEHVWYVATSDTWGMISCGFLFLFEISNQ